MASGAGASSFICDLRDTIAREVCFAGVYERVETAIVQTLLRPGMVFMDLGADWGYFTLLAASLIGSSGRVISLEPDPRSYALLTTNIELNHLPNVFAFQLAAADRDCALALCGYDERGENFGLSSIVARGTEHQFRVGARRVDDICRECHLPTVDLIKIDVEGAEDLVLAGMAAGLGQHTYRLVLLEIHPSLLGQRGVEVNNVLEPLLANGYCGWSIDHSADAARRAAYSSSLNISDYLHPITDHLAASEWPHVIFVAPNQGLL